jgi:hypothetical protein
VCHAPWVACGQNVTMERSPVETRCWSVTPASNHGRYGRDQSCPAKHRSLRIGNEALALCSSCCVWVKRPNRPKYVHVFVVMPFVSTKGVSAHKALTVYSECRHMFARLTRIGVGSEDITFRFSVEGFDFLSPEPKDKK